MRSFQQYREEESLEQPVAPNFQQSPMHPITPTNQTNTGATTTVKQNQPEKKDLNQLILLLSRKLGTKAQEYRNLLNDIKPENMAKLYELIEQLSTLKQTIGSKVINQANQRMSQQQ